MIKNIILFFLAYSYSVQSSNGQWKKLFNIQASVECMAVNGNNIFAGTLGAGLLITADNGQIWFPPDSTLRKITVVNAVTVSGKNILAGTYEKGLFLSRNNGITWTQVRNGFKSYNVNAFVTKGNVVYAGTSDGIFLSEDNGENWKRLSTVGLGENNVNTLLLLNNKLFAGTLHRGLFLLPDKDSLTWHTINTGLMDSSRHANYGYMDVSIMSLAAIGENIFAATFSNGVYRSANYGQNWSQVNNGLTDTVQNTLYKSLMDSMNVLNKNIDVMFSKPIAHTLITHGDNIFVGYGQKIFYSSNNGKSWSDITGSLERGGASSFSIDSKYIYAGTGSGGIWRRPLTELIVKDIH